MTEKNYIPIVEGASPDNPIPTQQYSDPEQVHPNREDFEATRKERLRMLRNETTIVEPSLIDKVWRGFDWLIAANNRIRFHAYAWIVIFGIWWVAMLVSILWLPASLSVIYDKTNSTFDIGASVFLLNLAGILLGIVFPAYVLCYGILSSAETYGRWKAKGERWKAKEE